jgi:hypothetical protein
LYKCGIAIFVGRRYWSGGLKKSTIVDKGGALDPAMNTPTTKRLESAPVGARRGSPILDEAQNLSGDTEVSHTPASKSSDQSTFVRVGATAGFLCAMAIIGSAAALAWRAYTDLPLLAEIEREDVQEMQASLERLGLTHQQLAQQVEALQQLQQKNEQSQHIGVQRLSDRLTSFQAELQNAKNTITNEKKKSSTGAKNHPSSTISDNNPGSAEKPPSKQN